MTLVCTVLACWFLTAPATASGGGIKVLEDSWEVDFPGGLSFTLVAEGNADIVEVQLLYRIVGSAMWSYAYPEFNPGGYVVSRIDLRIGDLHHVPPSIDLEYYYIIHNAQDNVHMTDTKLMHYSDNRFEWATSHIGPLSLLHHELSQSEVDAVSRKVDGTLDYLINLLKMDSVRPIKGLIYNSNLEAQPAFPRQSKVITEAQVFAGFAFPSSGIFVVVGLRPGIIIHEAAHLLLEQSLGPNALPVPAWLDEGFASYVEPDGIHSNWESSGSPSLPLEAMTIISGSPSSIATFYYKSESVVTYLIQDYGIESFQRFLGELTQGKTTEEALVRIYGFGVMDLDERWAASAQESLATAPYLPGYPWVNFSGLMLGIVALAVLIAAMLRYAVGRIRRVPDNPDNRLQPWEDPDLVDYYDHR